MRPTNRLTVAMTIHRLRMWWRRWGRGRERAIGSSGFLAILLIVLILTVGSRIRHGQVEEPPVDPSEPALVDLTLLRNAEKKGAVCLDGSPPGYHLQRGFGSGSDSWILHIEGGGWCKNAASCSSRKGTPLGSSRYMERQVLFSGILSYVPSQNPDFYNWNKVKIRYCDGASFSGNMENEVQNGTKLFFRGQRIWEAIMDELLVDGLTNAKKALLAGCSAGGLATFLHCDNFRARLPQKAIVKCLADAGFFLDIKDISGKSTMRSLYHDVVHLQDLARNLPKSCTSRMEPTQAGLRFLYCDRLSTQLCFFPQEIIKNIKTPLFIVNPAYDFWQVQFSLAPEASDPHQHWLRCRLNIHNCDSMQIESLHGFRTAMLNDLSEFQHNRSGGMFINSCFAHCQTQSAMTWHSPTSPRINNKTIAEAVGDWYFDRREVKEIDCLFPCNPTCYNLEFS